MTTKLNPIVEARLNGERFSTEFADALTLFNPEEVNRRLFAALSCTHKHDESVSVDDLARAFIDL